MADIAPSIFGAAMMAEQLVPLLTDAYRAASFAGRSGREEEESIPIAKSVRVLSILLRELAEAFDQRDSVYPRGMKHCVRQVLEDCTNICEELRGHFSGTGDRPREGIKTLEKAKMDQLQTTIDLQKSILMATIALASFSREVVDIRDTHESLDERIDRIRSKRAEAEDALARAIKWDKMRLLQENMDLTDTTNTTHTQPSASEASPAHLSRPSNLMKVASFASTRRFASPSPSEFAEGFDQSGVIGEESQSPSSRSFRANTTLQNLLTYWDEVQVQCDAVLQEQEMGQEHEQWEEGHSGPPRDTNGHYHDHLEERQDVAAFRSDRSPRRNDTSHAQDHSKKSAAPGPGPHSPPASHNSRSTSRSRSNASQNRSGDDTGSRRSAEAHHTSPRQHNESSRTLVHSTRTPSPLHEYRDEAYMPPSPPYSTISLVNEDHNVQRVIHHHVHHIHHHEHHHTTSHHTHYNTPPLPPRPAITAEPTPPNSHKKGSSIAEEVWNVLQANGGIQWEIRKKRGDKLLIRQYTGPSICRQGEAPWSHLALSGSAWTSLPRRYTSRPVLLAFSYDFKEDEQDFHVTEELEYNQVEEIIKLSLRDLHC